MHNCPTVTLACGTPTAVPGQSTPATCPAWCAGHHSTSDPLGTWIHESEPYRISVEEGTGRLTVCLYRVDEPHHAIVGDTSISVVSDLVDYHAEIALTFDETHQLTSALLDSANQALPPDDRTFLGAPMRPQPAITARTRA